MIQLSFKCESNNMASAREQILNQLGNVLIANGLRTYSSIRPLSEKLLDVVVNFETAQAQPEKKSEVKKEDSEILVLSVTATSDKPPVLKRHPKNLCHFCGKLFSKRSNMNQHIETVHFKIRKFVCSQCNTRFTQKSSLLSHIQTQHERGLVSFVHLG